MVHNGIVHNDYELQNKHEEMGIKYVSEQLDGRFNDSEALLYDIALYLEGYQDKITAEGSIAFVMVENDENGVPINLHFGRNTGSPLKMNFSELSLSLSSEGTGENILPDTLYTYEYATMKLSTLPIEIPEYQYTWTQPVTSIGYYLSDEEYYGKRARTYGRGYNAGMDSYNFYSDELVQQKGYQLATSLINDCETLEQALSAAQIGIDSANGKIKRINESIMDYDPKDPKYGELQTERYQQFSRIDALNEAIDIIGDWFFDEQSYNKNKQQTLAITEPGLKVEEV